MIPVSAIVYNSIGIIPLLLINSVSFLAAALMETRIGAEEKYIDEWKQGMESPEGETGHTLADGRSKEKGKFIKDLREGLSYIISEKDLLLGELLAGLLTAVLPDRMVLSIFMFICAVAAITVIGGNKKQVSAIYNIQA